jgi:hypothetical protein
LLPTKQYEDSGVSGRKEKLLKKIIINLIRGLVIPSLWLHALFLTLMNDFQIHPFHFFIGVVNNMRPSSILKINMINVEFGKISLTSEKILLTLRIYQ